MGDTNETQPPATDHAPGLVLHCRRCGVVLVTGENWYVSMARLGARTCKSCHKKRVADRRARLGSEPTSRKQKPATDDQARACECCGTQLPATPPAMAAFNNLDTYNTILEAWYGSCCNVCFRLKQEITFLEKVLDPKTSKRWIKDRYFQSDEDLAAACSRATDELDTAMKQLAARIAGVPVDRPVPAPSDKSSTESEGEEDDGGNGCNVF